MEIIMYCPSSNRWLCNVQKCNPYIYRGLHNCTNTYTNHRRNVQKRAKLHKIAHLHKLKTN